MRGCAKPPTATKLRKKSVIKQTGGDVKAKALCKTAVSVIANNLGFLVLVLFLAHIVRHIVKVEKILEVHVDRKLKLGSEVQVDRKLESEVNGLQSEFGKRIDDENLEGMVNGNEMGLDEISGFAKGVLKGNECLTEKRMNDESGKLGKQMDDESGKFNKRFRETDAKIRILEGVLNGIQWLTREEFKRWKGGEMGLDEIRAFAKEVVEKEIEKLAKGVVDIEIEKNAAKTLWMTVVWLGRVDYVVASGGASVKKHSEAYVGGSGACRVTEWLKGRSVRGDSVKLLQPSECFPFKGESGFVELKIRIAIVPETITLEHVVDKLKSKVF
uniref:SUN domain-containing protein n=1 Tax=Tanacetum cinerariifolium TaxID=118510 RepID=A0A6L2L3S5_TANCI|nr:hypothetical protein [Tanacetum cinerariifolium]